MSRLVEEVKRLSRKLGDIDRRVEKIEESIGESKEVQNLRERVEHMRLSYVPEITPEAPVPEFKVGDKFIPHKIRYTGGSLGWTSEMDKYDGKILTVAAIAADGDIQSDTNKGWYFSPSWCTKVEEPYNPKAGDYITIEHGDGKKDVGILSAIDMKERIYSLIVEIDAIGAIHINIVGFYQPTTVIRPSSKVEIEKLNLALEKIDKRFDKEKCELVGIPKYKKPAMGKMAIFWDNDRKLSVCKFFYMINDKGMFLDNSNIPWKNAILFESPEQYKNFLKEK